MTHGVISGRSWAAEEENYLPVALRLRLPGGFFLNHFYDFFAIFAGYFEKEECAWFEIAGGSIRGKPGDEEGEDPVVAGDRVESGRKAEAGMDAAIGDAEELFPRDIEFSAQMRKHDSFVVEHEAHRALGQGDNSPAEAEKKEDDYHGCAEEMAMAGGQDAAAVAAFGRMAARTAARDIAVAGAVTDGRAAGERHAAIRQPKREDIDQKRDREQQQGAAPGKQELEGRGADHQRFQFLFLVKRIRVVCHLFTPWALKFEGERADPR